MRVFLALPLPPEVLLGLQDGLARLQQRYGQLKVVRPEGIHITLVFLGERGEEEVGAISALLEDPSLAVRRIQASMAGYGQFPPRGVPRVLFCPVLDGAGEVIDLQRSASSVLLRGGVRFEEERRPFAPHVTLARNKGDRVDEEVVRELFSAERRFTFDRLVLFQSLLRPQGAEYRPVKTVLFR
jgi:2'-5' RNA ligase